MNVSFANSAFDPLYHETTRKLKWLVFARWVAVGGQILTAWLAHHFLDIEFNVWGLTACMGFAVVSNAWIHWKMETLGKYTRLVVAGVLIVDSLVLTAMLNWSGGAHNPFTSFYLLHVTLAAVLLPNYYAWGMSLLSIAGFVFLYFTAQSCCGDSFAVLSAGISQDMHFQGMVVSLALTAIFISYFVGKIQSELNRSHRKLREAQVDLEKQERFHSLATLAAGVAHELATPLGTIALVSKEIESEELSGNKHDELLEDVRIIRAEVDRCRTIIDRMNIENLALDSNPGIVSVRSIREDFKVILPEAIHKRTEITVAPGIDERCIRVPLVQLYTSLHALLKNACEADESGNKVSLAIDCAEERLVFRVSDRGEGIQPEDLGKLGEPFYTTKGPQKGMGLGLFLVRMFAENSAGSLHFEPPESGTGVTAILELPLLNTTA